MNTQELNERQKAILDRQAQLLDEQEREFKKTKALNERLERALPAWERYAEAPNN